MTIKVAAFYRWMAHSLHSMSQAGNADASSSAISIPSGRRHQYRFPAKSWRSLMF